MFHMKNPTQIRKAKATTIIQTMRNTLREFLKLSRQSPRSRASTDFGSLHA